MAGNMSKHKTTEFSGRSSQMRESEWLASEDIVGLGDVAAEIEHIFKHEQVEFDEGRKETVHAIAFKGKKKQLVLNATNRKTLVNMFGPETTEWIGQTVKLHVVSVKAFGEMTHGIRIRREGSEPLKMGAK